MHSSDNVPALIAAIGATGSGKSWYVKNRIRQAKPARLLVWDARQEYGELATPVYKLSEVLAIARSGKPFRLAYRPASFDRLPDQFGALCRIAFAVGHCTFVAEELSDVTQPSYAPPSWRQISTQGRHRGLTVYGLTQRPALIDKSFLGNCTTVRCGRLAYDADVNTMGRILRVPQPELLALTGHDWIERNLLDGTVTRSGVASARQTSPSRQKKPAR